ncbi:tape measure protein [Alishewanella sp. 16-MA]|uniref:Tape measure protein n=1 Tax=Alishewanella maricola TaxID=2795740 RepID=A0ABS8C1H3_9ALTE|nr:tape measure protein [Alishewanella maricola]MCB5226177.1 tape measure protein [Alishewanella maricola]
MSKNLELALKIAASVSGDKDLARMADAVRDVGQGAGEADPKADALAGKLDKLADQQKLIKEFEQSNKALDANTIAAYAAATQLDKLRDEAQDSGKPFVELARNVDIAEKQLEEMRVELANQATNHDRLQRELQQTGVETRNLTTEKRRVQNEFKRASTDVKKLGDDYLRANGQQRTFSQGAANVTSRLVALAGTYLGINRLWQTLTSIFTTGSQFEKLDVQFSALMGSVAGGEQATAWVKDFTKNTPLQLEEVSKAFVRLKAFGLDPMDGTLQGIVDQAFKLGGGFQEVEGISLALGQAWAKQKLQGEEILQLIERGVPVWDLLQQVTGKNTQELQKLSEQGQLGRDVIKQLMEEIARQSKGAAAANMTLLSGLISNAKDNIAQFYDLVSRSGAMDWLKEQIAELNAEFAEMAADGRLQEWAQRFSDTIVSAGTLVRDTGAALYEFREEIGWVAKAWLALKIGSFLGGVVDGAKLAVTQLKTYVTGVAAAEGATRGLEVTAKGFFRSLGTFILLLPVQWALEQFVKLKDAFFDLQNAQRELEKSQNALARSQREISAEFESLSKSIGMQITNIEQLLEAERAGLIVYDEKLGAYRKAKTAIEELTASEREQVGQLKLTAQEAAVAAEQIIAMSESYEITDASAESLNKQILLVIEALKTSDGQYSEHIAKLEQVAQRNRTNGLLYEETQALLGNTEEAYKALGITSVDTLERTAAKAQAAFNIIKAGEAPLEIQRQAFLKWAEASLNAGKATGDVVPEALRLEAANLGLTNAYNNLIESQNKNNKSLDNSANGLDKTQTEIAKTKESIESYRNTLNDASASSDAKRQAADKLADAEARLTEQTRRLNQIKEIEVATFTQLQRKLADYTAQMEALDELYKSNGISAQEYIQQRERYAEVIGIIQRMLAGLGDGEEQLQDKTENANLSLAEQQQRLESLAESSGVATRYISLLANAQQALKKEFDFSESTTQTLNSRLNELNGFIVQNMRVNDIWWRSLAQASNEVFEREKRIIIETLAMRRYTEQLSSSSLTMQQLLQISRAVDTQFSKLGDNDMAVLRQAITDAENRLLSFRDELEGTVSSLQDELDRLNNNQTAIEKRRYEQQTADLREKLKAAQASGDKEALSAAQQALKLAEEIYRIKQKQAQEEAAANGNTTGINRTGTTATSVTSPSTAAPLPMVAPAGTAPVTNNSNARTVRLELAMPGRTFTATIDSTEADRLLAQIERARSTSL